MVVGAPAHASPSASLTGCRIYSCVPISLSAAQGRTWVSVGCVIAGGAQRTGVACAQRGKPSSNSFFFLPTLLLPWRMFIELHSLSVSSHILSRSCTATFCHASLNDISVPGLRGSGPSIELHAGLRCSGRCARNSGGSGPDGDWQRSASDRRGIRR